ncbi:hypothetical protein K461DRAFT_296333 [Myriangium duriaei CBS 260.36]|uniref:Clr5 domain-containing protein n=1 Tax=Myriangium duriaei CBS 260.36 TaxID=1168546 RepID=A0A9P4MJL3_9PEZI|nr:hypothetical protein K461DRAFT_296333 [Myriangium duriaei CBS 260.36]
MSLLTAGKRTQWPTAKDWDKNKSKISELYETHTLKQVMESMEVFGFFATPKMYKTRISKWGLDKNRKDAEMRAIVIEADRRQKLNKPSICYARGKEVSYESVRKYFKRRNLTIEQVIAEATPASIPASIKCVTPAPEVLVVSPDLVTESVAAQSPLSSHPMSTKCVSPAVEIETGSLDLVSRQVVAAFTPPPRAPAPGSTVSDRRTFAAPVDEMLLASPELVTKQAVAESTLLQWPPALGPTGIDWRKFATPVDEVLLASPDQLTKQAGAESTLLQWPPALGPTVIEFVTPEPPMETDFMRDYVCCGISLDSLHDLLEHYEENHAKALTPAANRTAHDRTHCDQQSLINTRSEDLVTAAIALSSLRGGVFGKVSEVRTPEESATPWYFN